MFIVSKYILREHVGPFLFGYVPGFSLQGDTGDIVKAFILILLGTYAYSYFLSLHWVHVLKAGKRAGRADRALDGGK